MIVGDVSTGKRSLQFLPVLFFYITGNWVALRCIPSLLCSLGWLSREMREKESVLSDFIDFSVLILAPRNKSGSWVSGTLVLRWLKLSFKLGSWEASILGLVCRSRSVADTF